ncbi:class I adenylate-forming enzyme family protein [Streptomyces sp. NPDC087270]|uniref:class I adenylate-forming enzyme family protein n=1 Tax=Streptomyces sp. NPDC087270 TaxID=3365774 RepID=UPI0038081EDD
MTGGHLNNVGNVDRFLERLRSFEANEALISDNRRFRYGELLEAVRDWQRYLDSQAVGPGSVVSLEGGYSPGSCAALLALIGRGAIVVPLGRLPEARRAEFLDAAQVEVTLDVGADGGRRGASTGRTADHELYDRLRLAGLPGLVLFSSGTTGRSKASVLDFDKVLGRYRTLRKPLRILSFLSLDHIGGINTLLHTLSQGGTVVTVSERTPDTVFAAIAGHRVQVLPTTPTFLSMALLSGAAARHDTSSLELVTYGTEPMPQRTLRHLGDALPTVRFKQTYGLSELGILPTRSKSNDTVWLKLGGEGFEYKIINDILWVRSEMAMLGYLNAPTRFDDEGYFDTQDVVEVEGDYIRILGRRSEMINVGGEKVYPAEVESVLLDLENVADATVSGIPSPVTGMAVKAVVRLIADESGESVERRLRKACRQRLEPFKVPAVVEVSGDPQHNDRFKKMRGLS